MLTARQIEVVKATVPALQAHGEQITRTFYGFLLEAHPELRNVFNQAHQAKGDQAKALAGAVIAYGANIDALQNLGPAVTRIVHKHCSLDIRPEHYPLVGANLLKAVGHVLGDAATEEVVAAWAAAYGQLADILIGAEAAMYEDNAARGWSEFKPFRIAEKTPESTVITSFRLVPADGKPLPTHRAGQYLSVKLHVDGDPSVLMRQYTISCAPNESSYRISVKREPGGAVSNRLHDEFEVGDEILVHMPHGEFTLDETATGPVVLLAGGVGVTPMLAMLERLVETRTERSVTFIHASMNGDVHAFGEHVRGLVANRPNLQSVVVYENPLEGDTFDHTGRLDVDQLRAYVQAGADVYFCGPRGFMIAVDKALQTLGISDDRRHFEAFGPTIALQASLATA